MAASAQTLTWNYETEAALDPVNNGPELLAEFKTLITNSTDGWRVLDDDLSGSATYLWVGAPAAAPNADDRLFMWHNAAAGTINAANLQTLNQSVADGIYYGYCPGHGGSTPDATDPTAATPISSSRWTKLQGVGTLVSVASVMLITSQEVLVPLIKNGSGVVYFACAGPFIIGYDDLCGEAGDGGRIYGLSTGGTQNNGVWFSLWTTQITPPFGCYTTNAGYVRTTCFDPLSPTTLLDTRFYHDWPATLQASTNWQSDIRGGTTHIVRPIVHMGEARFSNNDGVIRPLGMLRQISPAYQKNAVTSVKNGAGGTVQSIVVPLTIGGAATYSIAFNNG